MSTSSPRIKLTTPTPSEYEFPHKPYDIQHQLMNELFLVLEEKGVGIFESPTGTGKSLTLTCAALCWLERHETAVQEDLRARITNVKQEIRRLEAEGAQTKDWITTQYAARQQQEELHELQSLNVLLQEHQQRLQQMRERVAEQKLTKPAIREAREEEYGDVGRNATIGNAEEWALEKQELLLADDATKEEKEVQTTRYRHVQIFFCSRTHTQLAQVVREVKRTSYGRRIRCISLASRQQLCIHPNVKQMSSVALINERCLDMAQSGRKAATSCTAAEECSAKKQQRMSSCPYKKAQVMQQLSERVLMDVLDIEQLVGAGTQSKACPYYASRAAIEDAQLIMLPYQMLLHHNTRLQSGIDLRGAVIIIDEAHNLLDTISQLHSCELTLQQLLISTQQVSAYKLKYASRFNTANLLRINQLLYVLKRLIKLLQLEGTGSTETTRMLRTYQLTAEGDFFNIDIFQLLEFCERTRFAQKLQGFAIRQQSTDTKRHNENEPPEKTTTVGLLQRLQQQHMQHTSKQQAPVAASEAKEEVDSPAKSELKPQTVSSPIRPLLAFLAALTENAEDGRILLHVAGKEQALDTTRSSYKYLLLNPGAHFQDVLRQARAIIIAGGTMQPTAELTEQLFHTCPERVRLHFYDHVVPAESVLAFAASVGPTGHSLCFNYAQRNSVEMLSELGMLLQNVCNVVPHGVVCFLPSYDYLETIYAHFERSGVLSNIAPKKRIFRESRSTAAAGQSVEQLLTAYSAAIRNTQGALLLSVVGGKLSEGLNFADELGRGVIVVGLPYPNRKSPELQERMQYLNTSLGTGAGNEYYENICMKAVNQCIGRSVRHIRDYACVFLLDERYSQERIREKLPNWIVRSLQLPRTFGVMQAATAKFFKQRSVITDK